MPPFIWFERFSRVSMRQEIGTYIEWFGSHKNFNCHEGNISYDLGPANLQKEVRTNVSLVESLKQQTLMNQYLSQWIYCPTTTKVQWIVVVACGGHLNWETFQKS